MTLHLEPDLKGTAFPFDFMAVDTLLCLLLYPCRKLYYCKHDRSNCDVKNNLAVKRLHYIDCTQKETEGRMEGELEMLVCR